jgi:hypothetical protein
VRAVTLDDGRPFEGQGAGKNRFFKSTNQDIRTPHVMLVGCWNVFYFMPLISEHFRETTRIILMYFVNPLLFWGVHKSLKLVIGQHSYFNVVLKVPDEVGGLLSRSASIFPSGLTIVWSVSNTRTTLFTQYTYLVLQSIFSLSELPAFEDLSNTGNSPLRNFLQSVVS